MTAVRKISRRGALWRLALAFTLAFVTCLAAASPSSAQELFDFFELTYDPVTFDKTDIHGDEVFHVNVAGRVSCVKDFILSASEARIVSQVVAEHAGSGAVVTLNPTYTINIKPFPSDVGETIEISQSVPLQFPPDAQYGDYHVIGKILEAKAKVLFWVPVTGFIPLEQQLGAVKYNAPGTAPSPQTVTVENTSPEPESPTPEPESPASSPEPEPAPVRPTTETSLIPWWVQIILLLAVITTVFNIVWFIRHRRRPLD